MGRKLSEQVITDDDLFLCGMERYQEPHRVLSQGLVVVSSSVLVEIHPY